jgi:hypothetical protein
VVFTDRFLSVWPNDTRAAFFERIPSLFPGVTEVYAHPVDDGAELRAYDPDHPDIRANDALALSDPAMLAMFETAETIRISYRPLRDLQRGERA